MNIFQIFNGLTKYQIKILLYLLSFFTMIKIFQKKGSSKSITNYWKRLYKIEEVSSDLKGLSVMEANAFHFKRQQKEAVFFSQYSALFLSFK